MAGHRVIPIPTGMHDGRSYLLLDEETNEAIAVDSDINISQILAALDAEDATLKYILLTHCHYDHVSSADALRAKTGALTAIHVLDELALSDPRLNMSEQFRQSRITGVHIDIRLQEGDTVTVGATEVKVLHTPGHTPGGCCFLAGNDLFTGDTLFRGNFGNTGFPGGDLNTLMLSAARLLSLEESIRIYPGHGEPSTIGRERVMSPISI